MDQGHGPGGNGHAVPVLRDRFDVFGRAVREVDGKHPLYLEFGVYEGETMRWWSEHLEHPDAQLVGFDSPDELPEGWRPGFGAGMFATDELRCSMTHALLYFDDLADRDHELRALNELLSRSSLDLVPLALAGGGTHMLFRVA